MHINLSDQNSIVNQFLLEMRDKNIQQDRMRFRKNAERLGEIMAYEISKTLPYKPTTIETSLGKSSIPVIEELPVLVTILRAGVPYFQGFINFFDKADAGFVGAFRKESNDTITIKLDYIAAPSVNDKIVILIDPMLATGKSIVDTVEAMLLKGTPKYLHIACLIAAPEGLNYLKEKLTLPFTIWTCAVDEKLNHQSYIVPGLGDAGDLSFGYKL